MSTNLVETFSIPIATSSLHRQQLTILLQKASKRRSSSEKNTTSNKTLVSEAASSRPVASTHTSRSAKDA
jgi:hypothetical protein